MSESRPFIRLGGLLAALTLAACSQSPLVSGAEPGTLEPQFGTAGYDSASDVAVGPGGVYATGTFGGDASTRRYNPYGELLTNSTTAQAGFDTTRAVAVGGDGFVYRVRQVEGSGTGADTEVRKSPKDFHYGVWTRSVASSGSDIAYGVAVDSGNNVYVAGFTTGSLEGSNQGSLDAFVRKYNADGDVLWTRQFGTSGMDVAEGVAVSSSGYVYVVGETRGGLEGSNQGGLDAFIRKYSSAGAVQWTRQFQLGGDDEANDVAVRGTGEVYVTGAYDYSASDQDGFVRKYSGSGGVTWTRTFGNEHTELVDGVSVDDEGSVYLAGATNGWLHGASEGGFDAFISKYSAGGALVWGQQFGTAGSDYAEAVATPKDDEVYVSGRSSGALAGGSSGGTDAFLRRMSEFGEEWTR